MPIPYHHRYAVFVGCFPLSVVHNGYITTGSGTTAVTSTVKYECNQFYKIPDNRTNILTCENSGQWSAPPLCIFGEINQCTFDLHIIINQFKLLIRCLHFNAIMIPICMYVCVYVCVSK